MESEENIGKIFFEGNKKSKKGYEKGLHNALEITYCGKKNEKSRGK